MQENTFSFGQNFALFSSNFGTPESTFRATRTVRAEYEFGARDSYRNRNRNSATPSSQIGGEAPDVYIFHLRDISQGQPPRPKRFNNRTGGPGSSQLSTLSGKPRSIFPNVQESPVAKKLTAKVGHMVTWQTTTIRRNQGRRFGLKTA